MGEKMRGLNSGLGWVGAFQELEGPMGLGGKRWLPFSRLGDQRAFWVSPAQPPGCHISVACWLCLLLLLLHLHLTPGETSGRFPMNG